MTLTLKSTESADGPEFISVSAISPTTLLTNSQGAGLGIRILKLIITNHDTGFTQLLDIYKVPSGGSISGDDYKIIQGVEIPKSGSPFGGTLDVREVAGMVLENGDSLQARADSSNKLTFDLSYLAES